MQNDARGHLLAKSGRHGQVYAGRVGIAHPVDRQGALVRHNRLRFAGPVETEKAQNYEIVALWVRIVSQPVYPTLYLEPVAPRLVIVLVSIGVTCLQSLLRRKV